MEGAFVRLALLNETADIGILVADLRSLGSNGKIGVGIPLG
jgi:hypothetical protein